MKYLIIREENVWVWGCTVRCVLELVALYSAKGFLGRIALWRRGVTALIRCIAYCTLFCSFWSHSSKSGWPCRSGTVLQYFSKSMASFSVIPDFTRFVLPSILSWVAHTRPQCFPFLLSQHMNHRAGCLQSS